MKNNNLVRRTNVFETLADIAAINHYHGQHFYFTACTLTDEQILNDIRLINSTGKNFRGISYKSGCHTFRRPNNNPCGYWKVLNLIANVDDGLTRREICERLSVKSLNLQLRALEWANLISLDRTCGTHKFKVTIFGKAYISAVYAEFMTI